MIEVGSQIPKLTFPFSMEAQTPFASLKLDLGVCSRRFEAALSPRRTALSLGVLGSADLEYLSSP
jgi:hypothetical protein